MHDDLKSFSQKTTQKFCEKPNNFEKTLNVQQKPKSQVKKREMHEEWMKKRHTRSRTCSLRLKNTWVWGLEFKREVWEVKKTKTIERDRGEMKKIRADPIYRKVINLDRSRSVERCRDLKCVKKLSKSCPGSVERCPQQKDLNGSRSYQESIEHSESFSMDQVAIENAIKSSWRGSIDSLAVERCPEAIEIA